MSSHIHGSTIVFINPCALLVLGVLVLVLAYGLWTLQGWTFWVVVAVEILNPIGGTIAVFSYYYPGEVLIEMVIPAIILIYLFVDRHVLSAFQIV